MSPCSIEELHLLKRKELQALAKQNGLKANQSSDVLISELETLLFRVENSPELVHVESLAEVVSVVEIIPEVCVEEHAPENVSQNEFIITVGVVVEALVANIWQTVEIKRVNKSSYRVVTEDKSEFTVKMNEIRQKQPVTIVDEPETISVVETNECELELDTQNDESFMRHEDEVQQLEEAAEDMSYLLDSKIEDSLQNYSSRMSSSRLSFHLRDTCEDLEHEEEEDEHEGENSLLDASFADPLQGEEEEVEREGEVDACEESFDTCDEGALSAVDEEEEEEDSEHFSNMDCSFSSAVETMTMTDLDSSICLTETRPHFSTNMGSIMEETSPAIAAEELSMYIEAEADEEEEEISAPSSSGFQPTPILNTKKSLTFQESANPFQRLVGGEGASKTPSKIDAALSARLNWKSSTKPVVFSHGVSSSSSSSSSSSVNMAPLPKTPRSAIKKMSDTPSSVSTVTTASRALVVKAPKIAPRLTKAQQLRQDAAKNKLDTQSRQLAEESTRNSSFQFAPALLTASLQVVTAAAASEKAAAKLGSTAPIVPLVVPSSRQSVMAAAVKTPQSVNAFNNKGRKSLIHASAVAGSTKRKLLEIAPPSVGSVSAAPLSTVTESATKRHKSSAPDFAKMHANQFSNSKSITSMVNKNNRSSAVASKMTTALAEALNGETTSFSSSSSSASSSSSGVQVVRSNTAPAATTTSTTSEVVTKKTVTATPAVTAPTSASKSAVRRHVSMLVPSIMSTTQHSSSALPGSALKARSSMAPSTSRTPLLSNALQPSSVTSTKTPLKSASRSTFGSYGPVDKENSCPMSVRNKFVNQRRGGANNALGGGDVKKTKSVKGPSISVEQKREVRRASFLEESNDKRRQSVCRGRKSSFALLGSIEEYALTGLAAVHEEQQVVEEDEDGPFSSSVGGGGGMRSPQEF